MARAQGWVAIPEGSLGEYPFAILRAEAIDEAIGWPEGAGQAERTFTSLYRLGEFELGISKPGKEAAPGFKRLNVNDMAPTVRMGGIKLLNAPESFEHLWGTFESLAKAGDYDRLALCGVLLLRNAFLLDHVHTGEGTLRYAPNKQAIEYLGIEPVESQLLPPGVLTYFLELVALNEDVKYVTLQGGETATAVARVKRTGRPNTLLTSLHAVLAMMRLVPIARLLQAASRGRGVAPITSLEARTLLQAYENKT